MVELSRLLRLRRSRLANRGAKLNAEPLEDRAVPALLGQQLFPADNPWNQSIANAPVAANSAAIIAHIGASIRVHPDWGADSPANGTSPLYGIPFNVVHGNSTAKVNVIIDNYPSESDIVPVPIPANAVLEGDYQNGPNPNGGGYNTNQRGDSHLIVWDEDNDVAYELYGVTRPSDPTLFPNNNNVELAHTDGLWHAAQETVWNMKTDTFRTLGETSADAAGLSILAGLVRPDEGLTTAQGGQGVINHALRMTLPSGDINPQYIYPASHMVTVSQGTNNLPLGSRLRLANTPAIDTLISNMPPESQIIARAMQQYGLIVADIGSAMYVTGASATIDTVDSPSTDLTWNTNDIFASNGLETLNAGDFQVVSLTPVVTGLSASSGAAGSIVTITGQNFSGAAGNLSVLFGSTPATSVNVLSDTQITAVAPSGSGMVDVTVRSGKIETDNVSGNPNANVNAPIFGYGTSAKTPADMFTYAAPTVAGVQVNDGSAQRSELRSISVTFSEPVAFNGGNANAAAAFQLTHVTDGFNVALAAAVSTSASGQTVVTLTFSGSETDSISALNGGLASLSDGRYTLTVQASQVSANGQALAGAGTADSNYVSPTDTNPPTLGQLDLYRLFGDTNGDGVDDQLDLGQFRSAFNTSAPSPLYNPVLDADNSGTIDQVDLGQFRQRFNSSVFPPMGPVVTTPPPTVESVQVNDGSAERSEVRSIRVTFSGPVTFSGGNANAAAAFQLNHLSDGHNVSLAAAVASDSQGRTVVALTFPGSETDPLSGENGELPSLADGRYSLTILSGSITGANGLALNGGSNYVSPTDTRGSGAGELGLFRLFGDVNGDGVVDQTDLGMFRSAFDSSVGNPMYLSYLDADNSGTIDQLDFGQFRSRFNASVF